MSKNTKKGILWFVGGRFSFALVGTAIKFFPFASVQFNFIRGLFVSIFLLPILCRRGVKAFYSVHPLLLATRIFLAAVGLMCQYYAIQNMTFAKATTLVAVQTLLIPVFAKIFLGEQVGLQRWIAIIIGYIGIWIAVDPVYTGIDFSEMMALSCAMIAAVVNVMSKQLVKTHAPEVLMFYAAATAVLLIGCAWYFWPYWAPALNIRPWPNMTLMELGILLICLGPIGMLAQYGYLKSYTYADLSLLAPYEYTSFIFSIFFGYVCFDEMPALSTWCGMSLIILATIMVTSYEIKQYRKAHKEEKS